MPKKNHLKKILDRCYYVATNISVEGLDVFKDPSDYQYFIGCIKRYLGNNAIKDKSGRIYIPLHQKIDLVAYGIVKNEFELLLFVKNADALPRLMRGVMAAYGAYYRNKYKYTGTMFADRYDIRQLSYGDVVSASKEVHELPLRKKQDGFTSLGMYLAGDTDFLSSKHISDQLHSDYADFFK